MEITSVSFLIFVGISLLIYWKLPTKYQWVLLLLDSLLFYFINVNAFTFIYLISAVLVAWLASGYFEKTEDAGKRKLVLVLSLIAVLGILAVLKYTNLLLNTVSFFKEIFKKEPVAAVRWLAPLGISFYTLMLVSYILDTYWGVTKREKNPLKLLLFTSYFPLMISGPISTYDDLGQKLFTEHRFDYDRVTAGIRRIGWGIAKKVVVADRLAFVTDYMFGNPDTFTGIWVWAACAVYVVELYFDFSGCMDIVIGASACFGIELIENFKAPFLSKTTQELWQRWHISLGEWLKKYIMYPLLKSDGLVKLTDKCRKKYGKKGKKYASFVAMLVLWSAMGLWHGNSWKFIIGEGLWFWLVIVLEQLTADAGKKFWTKLKVSPESLFLKIFRIVRTFALFCFGMLFFRADSLFASFKMIRNMFVHSSFIETLKNLYRGVWSQVGEIKGALVVAVFVVLSLMCDIKTYRDESMNERVKEKPLLVRWSLYILLVLTIVFLGIFGKSSFIYFGF